MQVQLMTFQSTVQLADMLQTQTDALPEWLTCLCCVPFANIKLSHLSVSSNHLKRPCYHPRSLNSQPPRNSSFIILSVYKSTSLSEVPFFPSFVSYMLYFHHSCVTITYHHASHISTIHISIFFRDNTFLQGLTFLFSAHASHPSCYCSPSCLRHTKPNQLPLSSITKYEVR